ncbi:hypothetical protein B7463_g1382, partial [Scytalidium lignicola]
MTDSTKGLLKRQAARQTSQSTRSDYMLNCMRAEELSSWSPYLALGYSVAVFSNSELGSSSPQLIYPIPPKGPQEQSIPSHVSTAPASEFGPGLPVLHLPLWRNEMPAGTPGTPMKQTRDATELLNYAWQRPIEGFSVRGVVRDVEIWSDHLPEEQALVAAYSPRLGRSSAIDPGGQFVFPKVSSEPLLYLTLTPRYSIFLESDRTGTLIVNAAISHTFGEPFTSGTSGQPQILQIQVVEQKSSKVLVSNKNVQISSTGNLFDFHLGLLPARFEPYELTIRATLLSPFNKHEQSFSASTSISVLPNPKRPASAVKIDNLYGGLYVQNAHNNWNGWYPVFPVGYYADGSYVTPDNVSFSNLDTYKNVGLNSINIVPDGGLPDQSYPTAQLEEYWDRMDELNLFNVYDMRFAFMNETRIEEQVTLWKNRTTLLMWYTGDEPDGWMYPLNSTLIAYNQIKAIDPYHPVSLVLNCQNFFYADYTLGADIVYEDAYPVGINATWSVSWDTACNTTYGDCGCDNCVGSLLDVPNRLDNIASYQEGLPIPRKPTWAVLQEFGGPGSQYWAVVPSAEEVEVMAMLAINHNAKGLSGWIYPSTAPVNNATGVLGTVFSTEPVIGFLFGANALKIESGGTLDVAAWIVGNQIMIGIANSNYQSSTAEVSIALPKLATPISKVIYGDKSWKVQGGKLVKKGLKALEVGIVIIDIIP